MTCQNLTLCPSVLMNIMCQLHTLWHTETHSCHLCITRPRSTTRLPLITKFLITLLQFTMKLSLNITILSLIKKLYLHTMRSSLLIMLLRFITKLPLHIMRW